ncbi:MAG: hypothetical protein GYA17_05505 [Chloroflexi bacterium]|nr:hypothetical protein [Anaerolineaceae bacterium]NMB87792.1 hypothetical protein [Chloroflexota bacterium]
MMVPWRKFFLLGLLLLAACTPAAVETQTPAPLPTPTDDGYPPPAKTATLAPPRVELSQAISRRQVQASIIGGGSEAILITFEPDRADTITVYVEAGTIFQPQNEGPAPMVARQAAEMTLRPGEDNATNALAVPAVSLDMKKAVPAPTDPYELGSGTLEIDLRRLLSYSGLSQQPFRVQQFAAWVITNNPRQRDMQEISPGGAATPEELDQVRSLLRSAGVSPTKYRAFQ